MARGRHCGFLAALLASCTAGGVETVGRTLWPDELYAEFSQGDLSNPAFPGVLDFESKAMTGGLTWYIGGPREVRVLDERVARSWNERRTRALPEPMDALEDEALDLSRKTGTFVDPLTGQTWVSPDQLYKVYASFGGVVVLILGGMFARKKLRKAINSETE